VVWRKGLREGGVSGERGSWLREKKEGEFLSCFIPSLLGGSKGGKGVMQDHFEI